MKKILIIYIDFERGYESGTFVLKYWAGQSFHSSHSQALKAAKRLAKAKVEDTGSSVIIKDYTK